LFELAEGDALVAGALGGGRGSTGAADRLCGAGMFGGGHFSCLICRRESGALYYVALIPVALIV
jgi:hypothetical protein